MMGQGSRRRRNLWFRAEPDPLSNVVKDLGLAADISFLFLLDGSRVVRGGLGSEAVTLILNGAGSLRCTCRRCLLGGCSLGDRDSPLRWRLGWCGRSRRS